MRKNSYNFETETERNRRSAATFSRSENHEITDWREQAKALFFVDHMGIGEIAAIVRKARETVSRFLNDCDGYDDEMEFRRERSANSRREYQRQWDKDNRFTAPMSITKESLRREHETAVRILSSEKY